MLMKQAMLYVCLQLVTKNHVGLIYILNYYSKKTSHPYLDRETFENRLSS